MSDTSQGPGWWMASDGKWYPPQSYQAPSPPPSSVGTSQPGASAVTTTPPGAPPMLTTSKYCVSCGNGLVAAAAICPRCGAPVAGSAFAQVPKQKSRAVAVVLAVFLSFWSFLYTYSTAKWKFWTGLGIVVAAWLLVILVAASNNGTGSPGVAGVFGLASLGVWIWAIVDRSVTPL